MIRVVVTGSECTGKSTLARALAEHYGAPWVPEYARQFVRDSGRAPEAADVETIARGQIEGEDRLAAGAGDLLVLDTDLLSTVVYARHYFGRCPPWVVDALEERRPDLYLLAGIDVPWVADGAMRDRGDRREEMQLLFLETLEEFDCPWLAVDGSAERRLHRAVRRLDRVLPHQSGPARPGGGSADVCG